MGGWRLTERGRLSVRGLRCCACGEVLRLEDRHGAAIDVAMSRPDYWVSSLAWFMGGVLVAIAAYRFC